MSSAHRSRRYGIGLLLALLLWLPAIPGQAKPDALVVQGTIDTTRVEPYVSWLCDPSGRLDFEQVRQRPFQALRRSAIAFGFRPGACWFHFRLDNRSPANQDLILQLDYPVLDDVELFSPGSPVPHVRTGDRQPFSRRPLASHSYLFPLHLEASRQQDYFLRVASSSALNVPLRLSSPDHFLARHEVNEWLNGAGFGIAIGLLLYHLFLWLAVREKVFRFYVLYVGLAVAYLLCLNGIAYRLWPDAPDWNGHAQLFFLYGMLAAGALFARDHLRTGIIEPRFDRWLPLAAAASGVFAWLQFALPLQTGYLLQPLLIIPVLLLIFAAALPRARHGGNEARLYLMGWMLLIAAALLLSLQGLGLFPQLSIAFTLQSLEIAFLLQQLLLALALAERLNTLKRERAEKEQAALRAEAESAAKTEFLARMSHEIRTPLNALLGTSQLLQDTSLDQTQRAYIATQLNSGQALLHVIDDILDYSKIVAGKIEPEDCDFNLPDLLDECLEVLSLKAREKSLALVCERARELPVHVRGDPGRLRQVLLNLMGNAIKFTDHGVVQLRASIGAEEDSGIRLRFEVEDSGIGIAADKLPQLFTSFTQADSSTARRYGGTGLGLAISKELVELMGGRIAVSSTPGQGTLFRFDVRLQKALPPVDASPVEPAMPGSCAGARVLVVEDNPVNQMVTREFLRKLGAEARLVASGQEALELLERNTSERFDVILMDCEMPLMDGFETTRRLRQWEARRGMAPHVVVALTAHALPEHRDRCLAAGMDDYLSKPLMLAQLAARLHAVLQRRR